MKKLLSLILALALCLALGAPALAADSVVVSPQNLSVDGKAAECEKYNINGSNYFKLRDMAMLLMGTPAAFGIGGFTGNHFSVDPATGRYTVFLGNRVRDRLTVLLPEAGKRRTDYGLQPDGRGRIQWTDGEWHPSSVDYVHQKDAHLHAVIETLFP